MSWSTRRNSTRVVVSGVGVVSSIGIGIDRFWPNLLAGTNGITRIERFDTAAGVSIGGEVRDFDAGRFLSTARARRYGRASQMAIAAARLALDDAGLPNRTARHDASVFVGTTMGECQLQERMMSSVIAGAGPHALASDSARVADSLLALNVAREVRCDGDAAVFPTACAAGNYAIGCAFDDIRAGRTAMALAGGSDAFSMIAYAGFSRMLSLAPDRCRPFDKDRQGIVIGEGAGMLVLESLEHAQARGARIRAELAGYGLSCDAHHMTIPHVDGVTAVIRRALASSRVEPARVGFISAHGTGTRMNDKTECEAIGRVFGARAAAVPVTSIKSMLGHTMGAASAIEAIACVMSLQEGRIPPTINFETPDPDCPVDCVPNRMRDAAVDAALNNSFAFGGNNAATVFTRWA